MSNPAIKCGHLAEAVRTSLIAMGYKDVFELYQHPGVLAVGYDPCLNKLDCEIGFYWYTDDFYYVEVGKNNMIRSANYTPDRFSVLLVEIELLLKKAVELDNAR